MKELRDLKDHRRAACLHQEGAEHRVGGMLPLSLSLHIYIYMCVCVCVCVCVFVCVCVCVVEGVRATGSVTTLQKCAAVPRRARY